ncbi:RNase H domain-containing protein [Forsythia ovata]|uniref:RNase H domain-containing protein n=1 Tax=Forsythia ovata TaxID=205694 RepID=A0ABD1W1F6_9LAMI
MEGGKIGQFGIFEGNGAYSVKSGYGELLGETERDGEASPPGLCSLGVEGLGRWRVIKPFLKHIEVGDVLLGLADACSLRELGQLGCILWVLWGERNKVVHGLGQRDNQVLVDSTGNIHEWDQVQGEKDGLVTRRALPQRWQPAPPGGLKINTDAVRPGAGFYTTGAVIRDECGFFVAMQEREVIGQLSAEDAEAMAVRDGLILARDRGYQIAVTQCGPLRVVNTHKSDISCVPNAAILLDIISL